MTEIQKFILRSVDVEDYKKVEITYETACEGDTLVYLRYTKTGEFIEVFTLPIDVEQIIYRNAKLSMLLNNSPMLTDRDKYFAVKDFYKDFDDIYYGMLYADIK